MEEYTPETFEQAHEPVTVQDPYRFQKIEEQFIPEASDISGRGWSNYFQGLPDDVVVLSDPTGLAMNSRHGRKSWESIAGLMEQTSQMERFSQKFEDNSNIERQLKQGFQGANSGAGVTPWTYEDELSEFDELLSEAAPAKLEDTFSIVPDIQSRLSDMEHGRNDFLPDINYAVWTGETYGEENAVAHNIPESHAMYQKSFQLMNQKLLEDNY